MTETNSESHLKKGEKTQIVNEFAEVTVRKVITQKGERLEIESPKLGFKTRLDAVALESLTWTEPELFSELLNEPYGPPEDE